MIRYYGRLMMGLLMDESARRSYDADRRSRLSPRVRLENVLQRARDSCAILRRDVVFLECLGEKELAFCVDSVVNIGY